MTFTKQCKEKLFKIMDKKTDKYFALENLKLILDERIGYITKGKHDVKLFKYYFRKNNKTFMLIKEAQTNIVNNLIEIKSYPERCEIITFLF